MTRRFFAALILALAFRPAVAQQCPVTGAADMAAVYPSTPLTYPMTSDRYAVQYKLDNGNWTDAHVYASVYGGTNASPYEPFTNYPTPPATSMSFVSIPANANTEVQLRVTKLWNAPFQATDRVSVRPGAREIPAVLMSDGTVSIQTRTASDFAGLQFILWWDRGTEGGAAQGLAFFLDAPYTRPSGPNVKIIAAPGDLAGDLSAFDTLDFEGTVAIAGPGPEGPGAQAFIVPAGVNNIFLGPGSWVQGKLRFTQSGAGHARRIYGPGVLDVSRFNYMWRQCRDSTTYPEHKVDGYQSISWEGSPAVPDAFVLDGIILTDSNYASTANLVNAVVNNVKVIGWNGNNDGLQLADGSRASNVFIRTGDDSLEIWGGSITVTNATVWQNDTGGVVNLGWLNKYPGDHDLIDGLYVVRTDWQIPTTDPGWNATTLAAQDNAVIASLMTPGTSYGMVDRPLFRNIYLDDSPRVFLSLKILPPDCNLIGLKVGGCPAIDLTLPSVVNLSIDNVFMPQSILDNPVGFQTLPAGFTYEFPAGTTHTLASDYTFTGTMNVLMTNVFIESAAGTLSPLLPSDAASTGRVVTNGENVNITYSVLRRRAQ